jgi:transposase
VLAGVLWVLNRHASWRELPEAFGPWRTIYGHYRHWRQTGLWPHLLRALNDTQAITPEVSL